MNPPVRRLLPPHGLRLALLAQIPGVVLAWPPRPSIWEAAVGILMLGVGAALNIAAVRRFQQGRIGVRPFTPAESLAAEGPFRWTRNPMYLGLVLICAAPAVAVSVPANLGIAALFGIWLHVRFVLPEEAFLRAEFGAQYEDYVRKVPRWIGIPRR